MKNSNSVETIVENTIPPSAEWKQFESEQEKIEKYREWKLISEKATVTKPLIYSGFYAKSPVPCDIVGYTQYDTYENAVIMLNGILHTINPSYLLQMQNIENEEESKTLKKERSTKGKSLIDFPKDFTAIDIETTGLSADYDEIIELAAIRVRNNKISDTFSTLVKPENEINGFITQLTGITNEMVQDSPHISEALPCFLNFVNDDVILGHNVNFDINFIYDVCLDNNFPAFSNNFVDTLRLSRRLYPDMKHHRLIDMVEHLNITASVFHRALADCESTLKCFITMTEDVIKQYGSIEKFQAELHKKYYNYNYVDARTITTDKTDFDTSHPLYGKVCVFTGKLEKMARQEAMQIVVDLGGECANNVTKSTNFLILGNNDYCSAIKDGKSNKQKKAEDYKLKGFDIEIMPESVFYDMIL